MSNNAYKTVLIALVELLKEQGQAGAGHIIFQRHKGPRFAHGGEHEFPHRHDVGGRSSGDARQQFVADVVKAALHLNVRVGGIEFVHQRLQKFPLVAAPRIPESQLHGGVRVLAAVASRQQEGQQGQTTESQKGDGNQPDVSAASVQLWRAGTVRGRF